MEDITKKLFLLLSDKIVQQTNTTLPLSPLSEQEAEEILSWAKKHSLAPIVADSLINNDLLTMPEQKERCKRLLMNAILLYQNQSAVLLHLCECFEKENILHIPLKGAVLKKLYPEPWLRTSCDIDVLVKPEDLKRATDLLTEKGYTYLAKGAHDVSFLSQNGVRVELHFDTIEKEHDPANVNSVLADIWSHATPKSEGKCEYVLSEEMFYFYHIAHMAQHFLRGGCGIRPFLDLIVLRKSMKEHTMKQNPLIEKGGLSAFSETANQMAEAWFLDMPYTQMLPAFEAFILSGGVYGSEENNIAMNQSKKGSKFQSIYHRIFMNYDDLKVQYPVLQTKRWLMPVMQVCRWTRPLFSKTVRSRSVQYYKINQSMDHEKVQDAEKLRQFLKL